MLALLEHFPSRLVRNISLGTGFSPLSLLRFLRMDGRASSRLKHLTECLAKDLFWDLHSETPAAPNACQPLGKPCSWTAFRTSSAAFGGARSR